MWLRGRVIDCVCVLVFVYVCVRVCVCVCLCYARGVGGEAVLTNAPAHKEAVVRAPGGVLPPRVRIGPLVQGLCVRVCVCV